MPDTRRPGCVRVQVEGRPLLTVPAEVVVSLGIRIGEPLRGDVAEGLARAADLEAAFRGALRALERRPFAARDLARRLVLRGHPPEAAEAAVARAAQLGLVDDERFARHYIETRFARGRGPGRLRRELTGLGVAPGVVDRLLAESISETAVQERMAALVRKRAAQLEGLNAGVRRRRVMAFLARRGYRGLQVRALVRRLVE